MNYYHNAPLMFLVQHIHIIQVHLMRILCLKQKVKRKLDHMLTKSDLEMAIKKTTYIVLIPVSRTPLLHWKMRLSLTPSCTGNSNHCHLPPSCTGNSNHCHLPPSCTGIIFSNVQHKKGVSAFTPLLRWENPKCKNYKSKHISKSIYLNKLKFLHLVYKHVISRLQCKTLFCPKCRLPPSCTEPS